MATSMPLLPSVLVWAWQSALLISFGSMTEAYGIVTALVGLYPVIVALLGVVFLGERLTRLQATGATLAMAGVVLVSI